jgi:hypothetical protein
MDHVTFNFINKISTAAVFLDIEQIVDTTWRVGLLYKLSKLEFSTNFIKLIDSFLSRRKFSVSVEGEMSMSREMQAGGPQGSVLFPTVSNIYINNAPKTLVWVQFKTWPGLVCMYSIQCQISKLGNNCYSPNCFLFISHQ